MSALFGHQLNHFSLYENSDDSDDNVHVFKPSFTLPFQCKPSSSVGVCSVFSSTTDDSSSALLPSSGRSTADVVDLKDDIIEISTEKAPKECVVCFQPTSCYHYDVPSCTGCKTFFRRCLVSEKEYKCHYGGHCDITRGQDCKGCRFERCLISGMNAAAIQYPKNVDGKGIVERVKTLKRKIVEDNKPVLSKMLPSFSQTKERSEIDFLLYVEAKQRRLRESWYNPEQLFGESLRDLLQKSSELSLADKYEKPSEWPLNENVIVERFKAPRTKRFANGKFFAVCDLLLTVEVAKILPAFNLLSLDDQEALLRHVVVVNTILTQSFYSYLQHTDVIIYPNGVVPLKLDQYLGREPMQIKVDTHTRSVQSLSRIGITPEQFVLLKAIIYCHPACDNLSAGGREIVRKYHEKYASILLWHLQSEFGGQAGATKYASLIGLIEAYFHFAEKTKQIHLMQKINIKCTKKRDMRLMDECMQ